MIGTIETHTYYGLRTRSWAVRSANLPAERDRFTGLTSALLSNIPGVTRALATQIKTGGLYDGARVPEDVLLEGLERLAIHTRVLNDSDGPKSFGPLLRSFGVSLKLLGQLPSGWCPDGHYFEGRRAAVRSLINSDERGISARLEAQLPDPRLNLWFRIVNLLDNGRFDHWEGCVHIPGIKVVDVFTG